VPPRKKYEEIADYLELQIFGGRLQTDDKLPSERDLMAQFGAGRSSVREAIFALQRKGLVAARAGTAARVTKPTAGTMVAELSGAVRHLLARPEGIRDLQNARLLFEVGLARRAALQATAEDLAQLRAALEANRQAADSESFQSTDALFHYTLAQIAGNDILTALNMALTDWLAEQRRVSGRAGGVTFADVYRQHEAIFEAIAAGDAPAAEAAMETHLKSVSANYWRTVAGGSL
jgi:GntR family transcriptional regulator, sialic acid-inducible nan operon repressor